MRTRQHLATLLTIAGTLAAPLALDACAGHAPAVYDPLAERYFVWNRAEDRRYRQWELETRVRHVDFARRPAEEQRAYLAWRHAH